MEKEGKNRFSEVLGILDQKTANENIDIAERTSAWLQEQENRLQKGKESLQKTEASIVEDPRYTELLELLTNVSKDIEERTHRSMSLNARFRIRNSFQFDMGFWNWTQKDLDSHGFNKRDYNEKLLDVGKIAATGNYLQLEEVELGFYGTSLRKGNKEIGSIGGYNDEYKFRAVVNGNLDKATLHSTKKSLTFDFDPVGWRSASEFLAEMVAFGDYVISGQSSGGLRTG